ncbi:MAG: tryptophan-rich sensory protein [Oscillospiraceae bacterium]|nr:tryptophan-rich sensory protein [Oscillospiraceae bacterium]
MWTKIRPYVGFCALALLVGGLSSVITQGEMEAFFALRQPPLSPPGWVFPVAWTILYLLMGVGMALVWRKSDGERRRRAVTIWGVQLAANFLWPMLFFLWQLRLLSLVWLVVLLILVAKMTSEFEKTSVPAARMQIPYLLWLLFAAYLNLGVWILNR